MAGDHLELVQCGRLDLVHALDVAGAADVARVGGEQAVGDGRAEDRAQQRVGLRRAVGFEVPYLACQVRIASGLMALIGMAPKAGAGRRGGSARTAGGSAARGDARPARSRRTRRRSAPWTVAPTRSAGEVHASRAISRFLRASQASASIFASKVPGGRSGGEDPAPCRRPGSGRWGACGRDRIPDDGSLANHARALPLMCVRAIYVRYLRPESALECPCLTRPVRRRVSAGQAHNTPSQGVVGKMVFGRVQTQYRPPERFRRVRGTFLDPEGPPGSIRGTRARLIPRVVPRPGRGTRRRPPIDLKPGQQSVRSGGAGSIWLLLL